MDFLTAGLLCVFLLLLFILIGVPVGLAFILSGFAMSVQLIGLSSTEGLLREVSYHSVAGPGWVAVPLFILMGSIGANAGFASKAYRAFDEFAAGIRGSLGIATAIGCALFGAISGSTLATAAIFGKLALPEMREYGYKKSFATGIIAASGTFASMIPPSIMLIIYAQFTGTSVGALFAAGIIPGIITALVYSVIIVIKAKTDVDLNVGRKRITKPIQERFTGLFTQGWTIILVSFVMLGGIYGGFFTPTEAAAFGSLFVLIVGVLERKISKFGDFLEPLRESANTTAMIFLINVGAMFYGRVLGLTRLPAELSMMVEALDIAPILIILIILFIYFILGMLIVPIGIFALTLPIVAPMISDLGYNLVWFGVLALKLTEIGAITPPVGLNVYALKGVVPKDVSLNDIFSGVWPFIIADLIVLVFLILFPQLSLWLPSILL